MSRKFEKKLRNMYRLISGLGGAAAAVAAASASIKAYSDKVSQDTYVKRRNNDCKVMQYMFSHLFIPLPPQKKKIKIFSIIYVFCEQKHVLYYRLLYFRNEN